MKDMLEFLGVLFICLILIAIFCEGSSKKGKDVEEVIEGIMTIGSLLERQHDYLLELERQGKCEYTKTKIYADYMELEKKGEEMEAKRKEKD